MTGIDHCYELINDIRKGVKKNMRDFMKEVALYGAEQAANYLSHVDTGETLGSITYSYGDHTASVYAGGNAIWIEFGTGVTNSDYPYPLPEGIVPHGEYGKKHGANPDGWWYPDEIAKSESGNGYESQGATWHHTYGIEPNPFMQQALNDMIEYVRKYGIKVVKGIEAR